MRTSRLILALILALIGAVWIAQGVGLLGGSAMSGSAFWAVVGVVLLAGAALTLALERRRSTKDVR